MTKAKIHLRVAQAASLLRSAACRTDVRRPANRNGPHIFCHASQMFPAGCRKLQAGSLRYPETRGRGRLFVRALLVMLCFCRCVSAEQALAPATVVVYNSAIPESFELARFYAQKRGIARDHLVALACSKEEEISREEYDSTIAETLRAVFIERQWWTVRTTDDQKQTLATSSIRFVALIKGIPLKIRAASNYPEDRPVGPPIGDRNEASVDQELAVLGLFSRQISGATSNAYFQSYRAITEWPNPTFLLVARLDAPSAATVKRMIVDAIETEKNGLWGRAYIDGAHNTSGGLQIGDQWLAGIYEQLHKVGIPVVYEETPALFPDGYPMSDCALYYGWYSGGVAGPFTQPGFRFVPGAVAVHIHSFSGATLRDATANWAGPLLTVGAAATIGNVYEPYLQLTPHLDILNDRLLHGFTFAESAYMSLPALSWMTVVIGDPLYRPYAAWLQLDEKRDSGRGFSDWKMYHDFVLKNSDKPPLEVRPVAKQAAARARNGPMTEDLGLLEEREGNFAAATSYFQQARSLYTKRDDILRAALEEADVWSKQKKPKRALEVVRSVLRIVADSPVKAMFKKVENELSAPAATPAAATKNP